MSPESYANQGTGSYNNPVASVSEAMGVIKSLNNAGEFAETYKISLLSGVYNEGIKIENFSNDNLVITGENAVIKGSKTIENDKFVKVSHMEILSRIPEAARDYIYGVNLEKYGYISSANENFRIFTKSGIGTIARYPNDDGVNSSADYMKTGEVTENGFKYTDSRAESWTNADDMYVYGMFEYDYFDDNYKASIDLENGVISVESGTDSISQDKPFYAYNLIEELDAENEYYFDKETGFLYVYSENIGSESYEISCEDDFAIKILNSERVTVSDVTVMNSYQDLIYVRNGENHFIENCELKNSVSRAAYLTGCENSVIDNCTMYNLGGGGVYLSSGNRKTLSGGGNVVKNCTIHDYQLINRSYTGAVNMMGMNHSVKNNLIYNGYSMGINMYGNNLLIENNELHHICEETSDMGVIYSHGDWTFRGNTINHNYVHDTKSHWLGADAIYLDYGVSGTTITNNIFENIAAIGIHLNGGRDTTVSNNLFIKNGTKSCEYGIIVSDGLNWGGTYEAQNKPPEILVTNLNEVDYQSEYYSVYDNLSNILEDEPVLPKYNKITGNLFVGTDNPVPHNWLKTVTTEQFVNELGGEINNYICEGDPGFVNMQSRDYRLNENAEIYTQFPDFKEITLDNIGPE